MYYAHPCTYCAQIFYIYHDSKEAAASALYYAIKQHLIDWEEDHKEYEMDDGPTADIDQIYYAMAEYTEEPYGNKIT